MVQLHKVANLNLWSVGIEDSAISVADLVACCAFSWQWTLGGYKTILPRWPTAPVENSPCTCFEQDYDSPSNRLSFLYSVVKHLSFIKASHTISIAPLVLVTVNTNTQLLAKVTHLSISLGSGVCPTARRGAVLEILGSAA